MHTLSEPLLGGFVVTAKQLLVIPQLEESSNTDEPAPPEVVASQRPPPTDFPGDLKANGDMAFDYYHQLYSRFMSVVKHTSCYIYIICLHTAL